MKSAQIYWIFLVITIYTFHATTYAATVFEWRTILHLAGQQRMLIQKMSKEMLLIIQGIEVEQNMINLENTAKDFQWVLTGLLNGDKRLKIIKTDNPAILQQLNKVMQLWNQFHQLIETILQGDTSKDVLKQLARQNLLLLEEMNQAVIMYENDSYPTLSKNQANILNLAGKLRMLTQKMTKEMLLVFSGVAPEENQAHLKKTMALFQQLLDGFLHGDATLGLQLTRNGAIRFQWRQVKKQWLYYESILKKSQYSQKDLLKAAKLNMILLKEVIKAFKISYIIK